MKYIVKQQEPQAFSQWKALANDDWQPTYSDLCGETKRVVKDALMAEQGYLCCYCERRLADNDSHIEHFRPQSDPIVDPLDFSNMLCSCQDQLKKGDPRHCGNLKAGRFDALLLISPFDPECEIRFSFNGDGSIRHADVNDLSAKETIRIIGLNIPKLRDLRKKAIEPFLDEALSTEEMRRFVTGYLEMDNQGMFGEFYTTIQYLFGAYAT